jgi:capsular polysaccharide biosynthesis protein
MLMDANQSRDNYIGNGITLKTLIRIFQKKKYSIISITVLFAVLAGIISVFIIPPVYNTRMNIIISMPETYHTEYGDYVLPLSTKDQYLHLLKSNEVLLNTIEDMEFKKKVTIEKLSDRVTIQEGEKETTSFSVIVEAATPKESLRLANTLYNNYIEFIDYMVKERTVNSFYNNFSIELDDLETSLTKEQEALKENQKLLEQITREYKSVNLDVIDYIGKNGSYILPQDTINPNYVKVEADVILNKQTINDLTRSINIKKQYLSQLEKEKEVIENYQNNGKKDNITIDLVSIVESNIFMPSELAAPTSKSNTSVSKNVIIGAVFGGMVGMLYGLLQAYWKDELLL